MSMKATGRVYMQHVLHTSEGNELYRRAHKIRNTHQSGPGDFWMFVDDDNVYLPGFAQQVKDVVAMDLHSPFFFRMAQGQILIWDQPELQWSNIDTGCGVIPSALVSSGKWGELSGGDAMYYTAIADKAPRYYLVDIVIFNYTGKA